MFEIFSKFTFCLVQCAVFDVRPTDPIDPVRYIAPPRIEQRMNYGRMKQFSLCNSRDNPTVYCREYR